MGELRETPTMSKAAYRPIEAAIRWAGLALHEEQIVEVLGGRLKPTQYDFPQWPQFYWCSERLFDALLNEDLPCGLDGRTTKVFPGLEHPKLTVRHVDLRCWIKRFYSYECPEFLFSPAERKPRRNSLVLLTRALIAERELRLPIIKRPGNPIKAADSAQKELSERAETTLLNIIGALVDLMLGLSPMGIPYSNFKTQDAIISALLANSERRLGLSKRTLEDKFSAANQLPGASPRPRVRSGQPR